MTHWIRYRHEGDEGFGTLSNGTIQVHGGDMFGQPRSLDERLPVDAVEVLMPVRPSKMICLWNNYRALAEKLEQAVPPEPLYFIKAPNAYLGPEQVIRKPASYDGRVVYEGELGIVIGRTCSNVEAVDAPSFIFGYTCINDVTALEILSRDPSFAQWTRAKGFDTFGVFGPVVATGLDAANLSVVTLLNGKERQNYSCSDMIFSPAELVSRISKDMTLHPGDIIACGTSLGVGPMRPGQTVEVLIDGIGGLRNRFE